MRRFVTLIALAVLVTGCSTPSELRHDGERSEYSLRLPAKDAALCMVRNADEFGFPLFPISTMNEATGGAFDVNVQSSSGLLAVARIVPATNGSTATIWRARVFVATFNLPERMAKGC